MRGGKESMCASVCKNVCEREEERESEKKKYVASPRGTRLYDHEKNACK